MKSIHKITNVFLFISVLGTILFFMQPHLSTFLLCLAISAAAFVFTVVSIPIINRMMLSSRSHLFGYDINKGEETKKIKVPESLGMVSGTIYILSVCVLIGILSKFSNSITQSQLLDYSAGLFSSLFMLFLGFADDVLDLKWRYKIVLPFFAVIPMILCYSGETNVLVPVPLRGKFFLGDFVDLGSLYRVYIANVAVFCSNSINIYSGINGFEAGQSIVIAVFVVIFNTLELNGPYHDQSVFAINCMLPFIATTLGLTYFNWYPSKVFVGDSFTYFSGMTLATVGILGHFSKTLLVFFIPQWINFFYSLPQLFRIYEIPRHRLPRFNPNTKKVEDSGNMTLINLVLRIFGPMTERTLTIVLCAFQVVCCSIGLLLRYYFMKFYYPIEEFQFYEKN